MVLDDTDTSHGPHELILSPIAQTNPLTQAITAQNASSDLLRLPQEIKQLVYENILGGQLIHICKDPVRPRSLNCYLCQAKHSEKEAERIFAASKEPWFSTDIESRHEVCYPPCVRDDPCFWYWTQKKDIATESYAQLSLAVLRCCRQMYQEARSITFSKSTISFRFLSDSPRFYYSSGRQIMSDMRSLHLDIMIESYLAGQLWWDNAFKEIASNMRSLQHIYINIQQLSKWEFKEPAECSFLEGLRSLKHLKLKTATVIVSDYHTPHSLSSQENGAERWTMLEKQEWAGYTKRVLLHQEEEQQPTIGEVV